MTSRPPRLLLACSLLILSVTGTYIGLSGYSMASSFSVADPEHRAHWQAMAVWYLALTGLAAATGIGGGAVLLRRRGRRNSRGPEPR
jgi:hypothetical protein